MVNKEKLKKITANIGDMCLKRRVITIIQELDVKTNEHVLDCGCGDGLYLVMLSELSHAKLHGFDMDSEGISKAQTHLKDKMVEFKQGDICSLPYSDNFFDKLICTEVLEHIPDDKKALAELYRVAKKDGTLTLTVPNYDYPFFWDPLNWTLEKAFKTHIKSGLWAGLWNMHLRLYKVDEITNLVKSAGFKIEKVSAITHYCVLFNHIILYSLKKLLNTGVLPQTITHSGDKFAFDESKQSKLVKLGYDFLNVIDKFNDNLSVHKSSAAIFVKAIK